MIETRIINGTSYDFEVPENEIMAREIIAKKFDDYEIKRITEFYKTTFYKCFNGEKKEIGRLFYDCESGKFHLFKFVKPTRHIMNKTGEVGVNGTLFSKLRIGDYIHFQIGDKKYKIRVEKAAKVGNYKNFGITAYNSELQFFIPISELTLIKKEFKNNVRQNKKSIQKESK